MKNFKNNILAAGILLISGAAVAQPYQANIPTKSQSQTQWCWATDSQSILEYYGTKKQQCEIVEYARTLKTATFGTTNCCSSPSGKCNQPNEIKYNYGITGMLEHFGKLTSTVTANQLPVATMTTVLGEKRPFVIGIMWNAGGGHVVVGCNYNKATSTMTVMDSWQNNSFTLVKYSGGSSLTTNSGTGTWKETLVVTTPYTSVGIADAGALAKEVTVYPNPSEGQLNIQSQYNLKTVNVFNATGQLVYSHAVNGDKSYSLNIPVAGFYNVQVVTENGFAYKKVVIGNN
jgi:hypothetical protein